MLKGLAKILAVTAALGTFAVASDAYAKDKARLTVGVHGVAVMNEEGISSYFGIRTGGNMPLTDDSSLSLYVHIGFLANYDAVEIETDIGLKYSPELNLDSINLYFFAGQGLMFGDSNRMTIITGLEAMIILDEEVSLFVEASGGIAFWLYEKESAYISLSLGISLP